MGGDGCEDRAQLGLVPLGTGNDLARTLAIPWRGRGLTPDADVLAAPGAVRRECVALQPLRRRIGRALSRAAEAGDAPRV
ncbi:diacylglycerol kinase family protein [Sorangium sp. So ce1014]|uniref:diacylglycerol kinase family protein n=1 Tax=Sorangium sp. So ce1014 TaxID=3133326 RepID=UPI003F60103C